MLQRTEGGKRQNVVIGAERPENGTGKKRKALGGGRTRGKKTRKHEFKEEKNKWVRKGQMAVGDGGGGPNTV